MDPKQYLEEYKSAIACSKIMMEIDYRFEDLLLPEHFFRDQRYPERCIKTMSRSELLQLIIDVNHSDSIDDLTARKFATCIDDLKIQLERQTTETSRLAAELADRINRHQSDVARQEAEIVRSIEKINENDRVNIELNAEISALNGAMLELYNSTSWRITAPLRLLSRIVKKAKWTIIYESKRLYQIRANLCTSAHHIWRILPIADRRKPIVKWTAYSNGQAVGDDGRNQHLVECQPQALNMITLDNKNLDLDKSINESCLPKWFYDERIDDYVPYRSQKSPKSDIRVIAFYLPQFHPIPENDRWWGKGFTEWTNVTKTKPQFLGHYQPHLPGELGFYDLRIPEVRYRQIELAKEYGIYGFCYHHYWFAGKRLLEYPFSQILADKSLDFPFCLCWANENWTRRWDGQENEILLAQEHSPEDDIAFIKDLDATLRDSRYIRINGRPLLIVYRASLLPEPQLTAQRWRKYCIDAGIGDLYLIAAQSFNITDPRLYGFDAAVEFPPHGIEIPRINEKISTLNPKYKGSIYDYRLVVELAGQRLQPDYKLFRTVMPSWDNEARRPSQGNVFYDSTPALYQSWMEAVCKYTMAVHNREERLVFVNAWNEWAEGSHLEPDRRYGYAYLQATANALRAFAQIDNGHLETTDTISALALPASSNDRAAKPE